MRTRATDSELLGVVWAVVLVQGAITVLSAIEASVGGLALGSLTAAGPTILLTLAGGTLALVAARGLRRRIQWARRLTLTAEWLVFGTGALNILATAVIRNQALGLAPLVTTIIAPLTVIFLLRRLKWLFVAPATTEPSSARALTRVLGDNG